MATYDALALIRARAASYRADSIKMQTSAQLRADPPAGLGADEADYWARNHREVADVLDGIAAQLLQAAPVPVVRATNNEFALVLKGNEIELTTDQGGRVKVRLFKVDELTDGQSAAVQEDRPFGLTREVAEDLCRPVAPGVL